MNVSDQPNAFDEGYYSCTRPEIQGLVKPTARRILDVGCAAGLLGHELKQKLGAEVWGVEYVPRAAEQAATRLDRVFPGRIEDALPQLPDGYFDTIICADVLEHLVDPWQVLVELKRKLAPGGEIVASIPNIRHWSVVKRLLEGRWQYVDAGILDRTHLRFFTWHECILMFEQADYRISHGEATLLNGDSGIPDDVVMALGNAGVDVRSLKEESMHYQFLLTASPASADGKQPAPPPKPSANLDRAEPVLTSIVILTWNQLPFTKNCLESIAGCTSEPYELIVVDNGSTDGTVEWLRERTASDNRLTVIENGSNRGFAAGCNQGIGAAKGEYILLINNDTVVTEGWLEGLREVLDRYPDAGIVGPMTNSASGVQVVPDPGYADSGEFSAWAARFRESNRYRTIPQRRLVGFCILFRRSLVEEIGLLDEEFGSGNYEDDDYCLRAELAGYRNLIAGDVFVHHEGGATFAGNRLDRGGENRKNRNLFKQKWEPSGIKEAQLRRWLSLNAMEEAEKTAERGEPDNAVSILVNQAIAATPSSPAPYFALADLLIGCGRHDEALQVVREMPPATDPAQKAEIEALCRAATGDDNAAREAAAKAGRRCWALVALGTLAAREGNAAEAEHHFRDAIAADPSRGSGWLSLGMLLWGEGKRDDAWQAVRRAVTVEPLGDALPIFADMAGRLGRLADAAALVGEAAAIHPDSIALARSHAQLLAEDSQEAAALNACENILARFGIHEEILQLALDLRERVGRHDRLAEGGTDSLSLCMIVKNEEGCLARCLASLKPVVHELIVVDTGSTDRTREIAAAFGAEVLEFPWTGNFSDARNHGIERAEGSWILVMDADEVIAPQDHDLLLETVASSAGKKEAWSVMTRNYTTRVNAHGWTANDGAYPAEEAAGGWHPSWKVRLFPNRPSIRFDGEVHEMVEKSLLADGYKVHKAPFVVHHYGGLEEDEQQATEKRRRYFDIGMQKLKNNPDDPVALTELAVQAGELGEYQAAIDLWDRVLAMAPENVEALFNKGYALIGLRRYDEALTVTGTVLKLTDDHKEAAFNYATCSLYAGEADDGIAVAESYSGRYPEYPPLHAVLTALYLASGKPDQALRTMETLRRLNYAITDYLADRAKILDALGRTTLAENICAFLS